MGIVHCDIKGANILVTEDGTIKLADFNSSKHIGGIAGAGSNPLKSMLGTPQVISRAGVED
jgi:serine/threonine protein kinase